MSIRTYRRKADRRQSFIYASIAAGEMTDNDQELIVLCRPNGDHDLPHRHRASLRRLRGDRDFAGLVITDGHKLRCPRCEQKMTWRAGE